MPESQTQARSSTSGHHALPPLPYAYGALDPVIDEDTMHLHHDKHHQAYVDGLNKALEKHPQWRTLPVEQLLRRLQELPEDIRTTVRNQGGGHHNHDLFWKVMTPGGSSMSSALKAQVEHDLGSVAAMKQQFEQAGQKHFGSGWVFLVWDAAQRRLEILSLPNQDSVLTLGKPGLLLCDLWEHAYYLTYQNRRADWLRAWWGVVHWDYVSQRLEAALRGDKLH